MMKPFFIKNQTFFNLHLKLWVKFPCSRHVHVNYLVIRNNLRDINLSDTIMILYDLLSDPSRGLTLCNCQASVLKMKCFTRYTTVYSTVPSI